jgi:hypothetical protein
MSPFLRQDVTRNLRVQVAHRANFLDRHSLGHEFLFHRHDLGLIGLAHNLVELSSYLFGRISGMQLLDDPVLCPNTGGICCRAIRSFQSP